MTCEHGTRDSRVQACEPRHTLNAFDHVWPRSFPLGELRTLLGAGTDALIQDVLGRQVNAPLWTLVDRGGKRWRATVARLAYRVAGGADPEPAAAFEVPELLHNASLVVDDIEDAATERRGGTPVHLAHGVPVALNAANAAYFRALAVLRTALPDGPRLRALDMLGEELFVAHLGQALDLTLAAYLKGDVGNRRGDQVGVTLRPAHYELLARAKTGALVRIAARLGAIAADGCATVEAALALWAGEIGVAYQIRDDVEDLDEGMSDLACDRVTYPLLAVLEDDGVAVRGLVFDWLAGGSAGRVASARLATLLAADETRERCRIAAHAAGARAAGALAFLPDGPARDSLLFLTRRLAGDASDPS